MKEKPRQVLNRFVQVLTLGKVKSAYTRKSDDRVDRFLSGLRPALYGSRPSLEDLLLIHKPERPLLPASSR